VSLQISHQRIGLLKLWPALKEDYPKTSLSLQGVYEAAVFHGKLRVLNFKSIDGPVHLYHYNFAPDVTLRKQHEAKGLKLLAMVEGNMVLQFSETEKWSLAKGMFYLLQQDDYCISLPKNCKAQYLLFNINDLAQRMKWELFPEGRYEMNTRMHACLSGIMKPPEMLASPPDWLSKEMVNFLYQIFEIQGQHVNGTGDLEYALAADRYIRENLPVDLANDQIAAAVGISHTCLKEIFPKYFNMGPAKWQNQLRIEWAMQLLKYSNKSIKEIYLACGYTRESTFRENFKEVTKLNPNTWRQIHKA